MARERERWHGPALVVGVERNQDGRARAYWITHSGQALLVAPEHLRLATRQEQLLPGAVAYLLRITADELREDAEQQYEDLTQEQPVDVPMEAPRQARGEPSQAPQEPERDVSPERPHLQEFQTPAAMPIVESEEEQLILATESEVDPLEQMAGEPEDEDFFELDEEEAGETTSGTRD